MCSDWVGWQLRQSGTRAGRGHDDDVWVGMASFVAGCLTGGAGLFAASRLVTGLAAKWATRVVMHDLYDENLWELVSAASRVGLQNIVEANMRAEQGTVIQRPLGSPKRFPDFGDLMFDVAQLRRMPTPHNTQIDTRVKIGPHADRPLVIEIPVMISAMAYGWALSERAKVGLALGAAAAGTASNTGQGPFLESERQAAKKLIYQYHRGNWTKGSEYFRRCDAIEIQMGQGANAGIGSILEPRFISVELSKQLGVSHGEPAISHACHAEVQSPGDLARLVGRLREQSDGVPIGVKLAPGKFLEEDLAVVLSAAVDFITLDGAQAATKGSPPMLEDDFGLPTLYALVRASRYLEQQGERDKVSLIISGGLKNPGDFLKALALGADAVYIGSLALFALSHKQVLYAVPFEPPTQVTWYNGAYSHKFDSVEGGKSLYRFLKSATEEMIEGVRALGKTSIHQVCRDDLFALDRRTAEICEVQLGYQPQETGVTKKR